MFIEKRGDEMKLMRCIGQSALYLVVEDGKAYPIPRAGGTWMHRILPGIPGGEDVRDGTYTVDDTKALRSLLSRAGSYGGFDGWLMYAETHYLSALCRATSCGDTCPLSVQDKRLLGFLHDDIIKMMNSRG